MNKHLYGWKKQTEDVRDYGFDRFVQIKNLNTTALPPIVSNRKWCSAVQDQGQLGSCTGNAWTGLLQYNENKIGVGKNFKWLSRLFVYYNERELSNNQAVDSGAQLRDGATVIAKQGVPWEYMWPYDVSKFTDKPNQNCYNSALANTIHSYYALNTLADMKTCLAAGQCFVFGFNVYQFFESQEMANTGILNMPTTEELSSGPIGGHAVMAIGYNDNTQMFTIKNSWGTGWGLPGNLTGYFGMPYQYMLTQASDWWTVLKDI